MAEIIQNEGGGKKGGKRRPKKGVAHVDMTPMVDLFMLLLTFFMLTTAFSKPKAMELILPDKKKDNTTPPKVDDSRTVNIILDEDKVYWYNGMCKPNEPLPELNETNFSKDGLRKMLLTRNKDIFVQIATLDKEVLEGKKKISNDSVAALKKAIHRADINGPVVLIKATEKAKYKSVVNTVDEMAITNISSYALVDLNVYEKKMLAKKEGKTTNP
jgi:biopolymer transport protein ExbD